MSPAKTKPKPSSPTPKPSANATNATDATDADDAAAITALVRELSDRLHIGNLPRARRNLGNVHAVPKAAIALALRLVEARGSGGVRFDTAAARRYLDEEARLRPLREALLAAMQRIDGHLLTLRAPPAKQTLALVASMKVQLAYEHTAETEIALDRLRAEIPITRKRGPRKKKATQPEEG